mmetsp:Transcript_30452/g.45092  ORF Transcript_30452/g.45092 Transcript_30452/m.45092 type:complete len:201 (-) Transcript_30452:817-1419(-)
MNVPTKQFTKQGLELQFGTNHVGHHYFTRLLLPSMMENGRVVTVSSVAHKNPTTAGKLDWDEAARSTKYSPWGAYGDSKLANILFSKRLQDLCIEQGRPDVMSVSLHPGVIATNLWRSTVPFFLQPAVQLISNKSVEQGSATSLFCSLAKTVEGGAYYDNCATAKPSAVAEDKQNRRDLWDYTEEFLTSKGYELPRELFR